MAVKVLIVDDSGFFRRRLKELISSSPDLEVIGAAANGKEAVEKTRELKPDVITMDYEMPVMDGITAVRQIMASTPTPILMFSSLTYEGARVTLDSLEAGAVDYLPKNFEEIAKSSSALKKRLFDAILTVARSGKKGGAPSSSVAQQTTPTIEAKPSESPSRSTRTALGRADKGAAKPVAKPPGDAGIAASPQRASKPSPKSYSLLVIGTSTGGPVALQKVLAQLPGNFPLPILLIQHMPSSFTPAFADRLNDLCKIEVKEACDGDMVKPGVALLAPGGQQMMVGKRGLVRILPGDERLNYKPSVDITFGSAANVYRDQVLAVVLTGMGADGCDGARLLKRNGSTVWAQDEATSVIYGMPMAVAKAGLADTILPLQAIAPSLLEIV